MTARTSLRARPAAATAAVATRLMPELGITTISDITHQDRLGLPVAVAIRPGGSTNRLHWGKGLSLDEARAGALMEALEFAVAESASAKGADFRLPLGDLAELLPDGVDIGDFALRRGIAVSLSRFTPAVWCENLLDRQSVLLPAELVLLPCPVESGIPMLYGWSSNGLASGNTQDEATLHALFEVLEHDAIAMDVDHDAPCVDPGTLPALFRNIADVWRALGIHLSVRSLPSEFGVACFEAVIEEPAGLVVRWSAGWGCHSDRDIALARSVCEAAQTRLVSIYLRGRRSPVGEAMKGSNLGAAKRAMFLRRFDPAPRMVEYDEVPNRSRRSARSTLDALVAGLVEAGVPAVFRRSMDGGPRAFSGLRVVRVIVPGCEPGMGPHIRAGPRLSRRLRQP